MRVGIVGLGEVGSAMAESLRQIRHEVCCFDPRPQSATAGRAGALGIPMHDDAVAFARAVDLVVVLVQSRRAAEVAELVVPRLSAGTDYADATAKPPAVRDAIAERCQRQEVAFTDIAIADTVSWPDRPVELIVSGPATGKVLSLFAGTRFKPRVVDNRRHVSAELKLFRSVFTKGLTGVLLETLSAAEKFGVRAEVQRSLLGFMQTDFGRTAEMLVGSSIKHARRRADEMEDVGVLVRGVLGGAPMTAATESILRGIAEADLAPATNLDGVVRELASSEVFATPAAGKHG
jgi:3-hydroxyisobutyrate dehydrogenase